MSVESIVSVESVPMPAGSGFGKVCWVVGSKGGEKKMREKYYTPGMTWWQRRRSDFLSWLSDKLFELGTKNEKE